MRAPHTQPVSPLILFSAKPGLTQCDTGGLCSEESVLERFQNILIVLIVWTRDKKDFDRQMERSHSGSWPLCCFFKHSCPLVFLFAYYMCLFLSSYNSSQFFIISHAFLPLSVFCCFKFWSFGAFRNPHCCLFVKACCFVALSSCLNTFSCCQVIGWLDICVNEQLKRWTVYQQRCN